MQVGFRKALSGPIEEDIGNALFAQASITSVSSIARSCIVAGAKSPPRAIDIEEVTELFILTRYAEPQTLAQVIVYTAANDFSRGVRDVKRATNDIVVTGPLAFMFRGHSPMSPQASEGSKIPLPDCVRSELSRLEEMLQEQCEPDELEHCSAALHELTQIYRNVQHFARISAVDTGHVLRWLTKVPLGFVRLMERRHQPALVVLAYFAAAMVAVRTVWFTKDWGVHALQGVRMALGESMRHWLEWPEEQVRTDLAALRGNTFYTLEEQFESVHCQ